MTSLFLSNASHSRCLPLSSVAFLLLRPPRAPPPEPPSPPNPPDPPDFQICFTFVDSCTQPASSSVIYGSPSSFSQSPGLMRPNLAHSVSMGLDSFESIIVLSCSAFIALMRSFTAICGFCLDLSSLVLTSLLWLSDCQFRVQAPSIVPTAILSSVTPGSLDVVLCNLALSVNSWDWMGLVQPCVSSSDMYVAFPCAPTAVGSSWAGIVMNCVCQRIQTGSLFNGQPQPSWALLPIYMTSKGLGLTEEDGWVIKSQPIQLSSQKVEAFLSFSDAAWLQSSICCGLGWCFKDPLNGKIHHGSFSRPFVSSVLVTEALALKAAIMAALTLGVSRLACISDCQELVLLANTGGHANEVDGILADFFRFMFMSSSVHFVPRAENCGADVLAKAGLLSCIPSSISGV
ncbi:predicted protein [Arabidopsis lyrata subsp. lyrata]|uniref:Predicted protein n=1 Tax=Arabidopsis lyrata subsp. lyrata TaxID=81972 RepID=D7KTP1_ARALL|nr:predicted protein [Arabidopsis lyrata subsp. lyrata]